MLAYLGQITKGVWNLATKATALKKKEGGSMLSKRKLDLDYTVYIYKTSRSPLYSRKLQKSQEEMKKNETFRRKEDF